MVLEPGRVRLTKGPKENRARPSVDVLFRSAAYHLGPRVVGVILSGALDDGTAGLWAIKDRGGLAIVQDPNDAQHPSMPTSALHNVAVDYTATLPEIAPILARLAGEPVQEHADRALSEKMHIETKIGLEHKISGPDMMQLGELSQFTCPECHGSLLQLTNGNLKRFRCFTGYPLPAIVARRPDRLRSDVLVDCDPNDRRTSAAPQTSSAACGRG
jgi:two-component system chemotaxis response regulator CheB